MANNFYPATGLIGGVAGDLDNIDGAGLADGDGAVVITDGIAYLYHLDATSAAGESSPTVIAPDDNPGDKRWILQDVMCSGLHIFAATGNVTGLIETDNGYAQFQLDGVIEEDGTIGALTFLNAGDSVGQIYVKRTGANDAGSLIVQTQPTGGGMTDRLTIASDGGVFAFALKSGATQAAAGAAEDELWVDTDDDNTIKLGAAV